MELVVTPSEKVYQDTEKNSKTEQLGRNIVAKLASKDIPVTEKIQRGEIVFEVEEKDIAEAVHHLESLPGVGSIAPCIKVSAEPGKVVEKFDDHGIEPREYNVSMIPDDSEMVEDIIDKLGEEGWRRTENPDVDLTVRKIEEDGGEYFLISLHTSKGIGGLPTEEGKEVVVTFRDRADAYAAYRYIIEGYIVHPLTIKKNTDDLKEGLRFLEEYVPSTKPVVMKSETWQEGVEKAVKLLNPEKVVTGRLKGEDSFINAENISVPLDEPLKDMEEDEVLQMYENIRPIIL